LIPRNAASQTCRAAAEQRRVGGVHNRLHALLRDVTGDDGDAIRKRDHGLRDK
jgi:hypothetical protein